jgi:hypothetical protein
MVAAAPVRLVGHVPIASRIADRRMILTGLLFVGFLMWVARNYNGIRLGSAPSEHIAVPPFTSSRLFFHFSFLATLWRCASSIQPARRCRSRSRSRGRPSLADRA